MNIRTKALCVATLMLFSLTANAGLITYSDRATFQNAVTEALVFEGFNDSFSSSSSSSSSRDFPVGGETALNVSVSISDFMSTSSSSLVSEGIAALGLREEQTSTFLFSEAIFAVGFDVNQLSTAIIDYSDSAGNFVANAVTPNSGGSTFFGVIGHSSLNSFILASTGGAFGEFYGLDALEYSTASVASVPAPATLVLFALGLAGLGWSRRV